MHDTSPDATLAAPPPAWPRPGGGAAAVASVGGGRFAWVTLTPVLLHPCKVAILEALAWVGEPLSASLLAKMLAERGLYNSVVSHHLRELAKAGVIEIKREQPVRGSVAKFFGFTTRLRAEALRRDALYDQLSGCLRELDGINEAIRYGNYEAAKQSSETVSVELRQLMDDLGLGERQWQASTSADLIT